MQCIIAEKPFKIPLFSKTGSRNMAEICTIIFLTLFSYSTSVVIWALRRLLLPFLIRAGPDFSKFRAKPTKSGFRVFVQYLIAIYRKSRYPRETIFGSVVVRWELYWYASKDLLCSINLADRWRCKCAVRATVKKHARAGYFEHPSLPHRTSFCSEIFRFARHVRFL